MVLEYIQIRLHTFASLGASMLSIKCSLQAWLAFRTTIFIGINLSATVHIVLQNFLSGYNYQLKSHQ